MGHPALVICFGDSLTAGFQSPTPENPAGVETPYGRFVQDQLGGAVVVRISGICGELTGEMLMRVRRDVLNRKPDYVPILGGTNDLGGNASPDEVFGNLARMYEWILSDGGIPIPVTVPSIRVENVQDSPEGREWVAGHLVRRGRLNRLIGEYAVSNRLAYVDLCSATAEPESGQLARRYSNDGLHLTTAGYRLFGEMIAEVLKPLLRRSGQA